MVVTILIGVQPVALVIALGWLSGRVGLLRHADADVLATFVIRFALPFSLFGGAFDTPPDKLANIGLWLCLAFGLMSTYIIALGVGCFIFKRDLRTATMQALVCAFPDLVYFGAPILLAMFGPIGFLAVAMGNLVTGLQILPLTTMLTNVSDRKEAGETGSWVILGNSLLSAVTKPIVWLPILGAGLSASHVTLPGPVLTDIDTVGRAASGVELFALGLMLNGEPFAINANVLTNIGIKNFLNPALMALGAVALNLDTDSARQAVITGALPTATAAAMFAVNNKTYTAEATSTILISTILGIGMAALMAFLSQQG